MSQAADWLTYLEPELPRLLEIRHQLHAHPELSFEECETSALVLRELKKLNNLEIRSGLAKGTGIVAVLRGRAPGWDAREAESVLLRADMDALPIDEQTALPYKSQVPGKMHACGHDGHTTILLGAAKVLAAHRERLKGNVVFCFQPAEENGGGGRYMVEEGALENPKCSSAFALHAQPSVAVGHVAVKPGPSQAATDGFRIVVKGRGGHGAAPHLAIDPIVLGARIVEALQSIVSREVNPVDSAVVTVGAIHAGTARNIIPDSLEMSGTIRTLKDDVRQKVFAAVRRTAEHLCAAAGASASVELNEGYPAMINHPASAQFVLSIARELLGADKTEELPNPSMGGEDFAYYLQKVPGTLFRVGVATRPDYPGLHNPSFDFSDGAIPLGVAMFCRIAEAYLQSTTETRRHGEGR